MKTNRERSESDYVGPRKIVLCGKVSESLSEQVRQLVKGGKYGTINDFVEQAILEKMKRETENGGISFGE
ncbi:MAG: hypothetical protein J5673_04870 [Candidatus Methanomethylophilaceae archaeon]|nr:hypothetical protein [Candidatus Methanomethylophilaceae archaeon]MBO6084280.1 hypothetical protein [Candidatus Methanomethylophilaceae archaeon]MBO7351991.1 hypothetical protein [Candidatus Methanomethylophilaceae archaeon]MBP5734337.1 hypothetical protein [Candidatus Methanomethylophilaceae archaeon]